MLEEMVLWEALDPHIHFPKMRGYSNENLTWWPWWTGEGSVFFLLTSCGLSRFSFCNVILQKWILLFFFFLIQSFTLTDLFPVCLVEEVKQETQNFKIVCHMMMAVCELDQCKGLMSYPAWFYPCPGLFLDMNMQWLRKYWFLFVWSGKEGSFFNQKKIKSPTFIQSIADFTFSGSNKAIFCLWLLCKWLPNEPSCYIPPENWQEEPHQGFLWRGRVVISWCCCLQLLTFVRNTSVFLP